MGFDATASNTGDDKGACFFLQKHLDPNLLNSACRHHIYEILLRSFFEVNFSKSSAPPEDSMSERFAKAWKNLDHKSFESGVECR